MTNNIKNLLDEVKNIIQELKTNTNLTGQPKTDLEKRINHILDKSNPRHTNLTADLQIDLKELAKIEKALGAEKLEQAKKQKELEDKNKQLEADNSNKDQQIKEKEEDIGKKITKELIEKLTKLEPGKVDETKLQELKTLLEEVKNKKVEADLTETNNKVKEVSDKVEKIKPSEGKVDYWSMGACGIGGLILGGIIYLAFTQAGDKKEAVRERDNNDE